MNRAKLNAVIDSLMALTFVPTAVSGLVLFFFPHVSSLQGRSRVFAGLDYGTWSTVHQTGGLILVALVILHLALHWRIGLGLVRNLFRRPAQD